MDPAVPGSLFVDRSAPGGFIPPPHDHAPNGPPPPEHVYGEQAPPAGPTRGRPARPAPGIPSRGRVKAGRWFTDQTSQTDQAAYPDQMAHPDQVAAEPPPGDPQRPEDTPSRGKNGKKRKATKRTKRRKSSGSFAALTDWGLTERQQRILLGTAGGGALLLIAVVLTVLVAQVAQLAEPPRATAGDGLRIDLARPNDYQGWSSLQQFAPIADRKNDPKPLTAEEVFAAKTLKSGKITLKLVARKADKDCAAALWGEELLANLAETGCTQVVRGLYRSADGRYVAQYTLFNMSGVEAADGFVELLTTMHRGGWVRPLENRSAAFPADGYTEASGHAMGHLAGLVWIGRADGAEPTSKDDFVALSLAVRTAEKAVFTRVVAAGGKSTAPPR